MYLTRSFDLEEFLVSQTAARMGHTIVPSDEERNNLQRLCETVLQPLRDRLACAIMVSSGLRPEWLNKAIGGSKTSAHMYGCAADVLISGWINEEVVHYLSVSDLPFDQCILEYPPNGWVHIGINRIGAPLRREILTIKKLNGSDVTVPGIHP